MLKLRPNNRSPDTINTCAHSYSRSGSLKPSNKVQGTNAFRDTTTTPTTTTTTTTKTTTTTNRRWGKGKIGNRRNRGLGRRLGRRKRDLGDKSYYRQILCNLICKKRQ